MFGSNAFGWPYPGQGYAGQAFLLPFINPQTQVFAPQLQNENLNVPFVASETQVHALKLSLSFTAPFVAATTVVHKQRHSTTRFRSRVRLRFRSRNRPITVGESTVSGCSANSAASTRSNFRIPPL